MNDAIDRFNEIYSDKAYSKRKFDEVIPFHGIMIPPDFLSNIIDCLRNLDISILIMKLDTGIEIKVSISFKDTNTKITSDSLFIKLN